MPEDSCIYALILALCCYVATLLLNLMNTARKNDSITYNH